MFFDVFFSICQTPVEGYIAIAGENQFRADGVFRV